MNNLQQLYEDNFRQKQLAVADVIYQCQLETGDHYYLNVQKDNLEFGLGCHPTPTLTLYFPDTRVPFQIATGELDPMDAFLTGAFRADGYLLLVMQYLMLFGTLSAQADLR